MYIICYIVKNDIMIPLNNVVAVISYEYTKFVNNSRYLQIQYIHMK